MFYIHSLCKLCIVIDRYHFVRFVLLLIDVTMNLQGYSKSSHASWGISAAATVLSSYSVGLFPSNELVLVKK